MSKPQVKSYSAEFKERAATGHWGRSHRREAAAEMQRTPSGRRFSAAHRNDP